MNEQTVIYDPMLRHCPLCFEEGAIVELGRITRKGSADRLICQHHGELPTTDGRRKDRAHE